jgi:hypothetical protein
MGGFDRLDDDDAGTVFRDVITLALAGFVAAVILLLPHIAARAAKTSDGAGIPGDVIVEATWPSDMDTDVDLWVQGPGDIPVGYSSKSGGLFNLLRDDLGRTMDVTDLNHEVTIARGRLPGEYIVNLHLYRNVTGRLPVPVKVVVSTKAEDGQSARQILYRDAAVLRHEGEEITVFRFKLDAAGNLLRNSVSDLHRPLRSGAKS